MRAFAPAAAIALLAACKPPPTDAELDRELPPEELVFASEPLPSPDTEGAVWARSSTPGRIIYGIPGDPALVALECLREDNAAAKLRIARLAPADEGAGALLALVGNGAVGRIAVDATPLGNGFAWQGEEPADSRSWDPLDGPRRVTLTVPGAGMVTLNRSQEPAALLRSCRSDPDAPGQPADPE